MKTLLLCCLFLVSCSGSKYYRQIDKKEFFDSKFSGRYDKAILKKFEALETGSGHIVYLFFPNGKIYDAYIAALIYDVDHAQYYSVLNKTGKPKDTTIEPITFNSPDERHYIVSKYLEGKIKYLLWLSDVGHRNGRYTIDIIYDINLREKKVIKYDFPEIVFLDSLPIYDTQLGRDILVQNHIPLYQD